MFEQTYEAARAEFRTAALAAGCRLESLPVCEGEHEASDGTPLTIDVAVHGAGSTRALLVTSGVHGAEGLSGSACQRQLLADGLPDDRRVVLVHAVNPFGVARNRRANEHNVDLNRNFLDTGESYTGCHPKYRDLDAALNPRTPHGRFEAFLLRAAWLTLRHGSSALRQAIAEGQFEFFQGLFWGGDQLEQSARHLVEGLPRWLEGTERIVHVDLHTGLGERGTPTLLADTSEDPEARARLERIFGARLEPWDATVGVAYRIRGGLPDAVGRLFGDRIDSVTCEFGTLPPVRVLRALRAENQAHHFGGDVAGAKAMMSEAFNPPSSAWREAVLQAGREILGTAMASLAT